MQAGRLPLHEPGLAELVERNALIVERNALLTARETLTAERDKLAAGTEPGAAGDDLVSGQVTQLSATMPIA